MTGIRTICICGAGTMGSGIAQVAAMAGFETILFDLDQVILEKSKQVIRKNLEKLLIKQKITPELMEQTMNNLSFTSSPKDCLADLFIEAIIEQKAAKISLFNQLAAINKSAVIYATNTSSISVNELAAAIPYPARMIGMHFFNPAPAMKLVEIVTTAETDKAIISTISSVVQKMGKVPVICKDAPGFIVNRVARHYYLEAMQLVESGSAGVETIDAIMESSGFKMGPFKLMDLIGMDINYRVSNIVWEALGKPKRLTPSAIQEQKVKEGKLGRKTGEGFYTYND